MLGLGNDETKACAFVKTFSLHFPFLSLYLVSFSPTSFFHDFGKLTSSYSCLPSFTSRKKGTDFLPFVKWLKKKNTKEGLWSPWVTCPPLWPAGLWLAAPGESYDWAEGPHTKEDAIHRRMRGDEQTESSWSPCREARWEAGVWTNLQPTTAN